MRKKYLYLLLMLVFILSGCSKNRDRFAGDLMELEPAAGTDKSFEKREKELKKDIAKFRTILNKKIEAGKKLGLYYKMLGRLYMNEGIYKEALENFKNAIEYESGNYTLYYFAGVCSGSYGKTLIDSDEKNKYIADSLKYYWKALELKEDYTKAMYGAAVILSFEMEDLPAAVSLLERVVVLDEKNYDAKFLLGRNYLSLGRVRDAARIYDDIAVNAADEKMKEQAAANRDEIKER